MFSSLISLMPCGNGRGFGGPDASGISDVNEFCASKNNKMNGSVDASFKHRISRFQIMAILQAARAQELGLRVEEAKSWGLNRALFYAAANEVGNEPRK